MKDNVCAGAMGNELSFVGETGTGCLIYRETTGGYVVRHDQNALSRQRVATLASAYATCQQLEPQRPALE